MSCDDNEWARIGNCLTSEWAGRAHTWCRLCDASCSRRTPSRARLASARVFLTQDRCCRRVGGSRVRSRSTLLTLLHAPAAFAIRAPLVAQLVERSGFEAPVGK